MNQALFHFRDTIKLDHKTTSTRIQNMWQVMIYDFTTRMQHTTTQHMDAPWFMTSSRPVLPILHSETKANTTQEQQWK